MVEKNAAYNRDTRSDVFAEDDPLAELARIVGFDERPSHVVPVAAQKPAQPVERREPEFNLEDELLREFEIYDAPRLDTVTEFSPREAVEQVHQAFERPATPAYHDEPQAPSVYAEPESSYSPSYEEEVSAYPQQLQNYAVEPEVNVPEPGNWDYADEPEVAEYPAPVVEPTPVHVHTSSEPTQRFEPLASVEEAFNLADELELNFGPQAPALQVQNTAPQDGVPQNAPHLHRSSLEVSGLRLPLANFGSRATPVAPPRPQPEPVSHTPVEPAFEPIPQPQPVEQFSPIDEMLYDVDRYSVRNDNVAVEAPVAAPVAPAPVNVAPVSFRAEPVSPEVFQVAPAFYDTPRSEPAPQAPKNVAPVQAAPAPIADFEPFADDAFELALDDIDLDFDLSDIGNVEPVQQVQPIEMPKVVPVPVAPVAVAAAPVVAAVATQRPVPVAPAPVSFSYAPQPQPVKAAPVVAKAPVEPEPLPFDHGQIGDTEDRPETIGEMEVPDLPVGVFEPKPAPRRHEDDLDLDTELASLFTPASNGGLDRHKNTPNQPAAHLQQAAAPFENLDDFEKALEADFRNSMKAASESRAETQYAPHNVYDQPIDHYDGEARSSRRWIVPVAALGVVLIAGGVYALMSSGSQTSGTGAPIIISADNDPVKEVPENPGGKTVPNQDKAVYDRVAGQSAVDPKQPSLISSNEEPVDVVQKTLIPENLPLEGENEADFGNLGTPVGETEDPRLLAQQDDASARPSETDNSAPAVSPRKVRTMIVKPDGTLVAQEVPETPAAATQTSLPAPEPAPLNPASNAAAANDVLKVIETSPVAVAAPNQQASIEAPAATTPAVETPSAPVPSARPAQQQTNVVATVTNQGNVVANQPAPVAPAQTQQAATTQNTVSTGGYYIQIASLPSEAEAQKSFQNLSGKFGSVIGGRGVDIKAAEIAGKGTYYRVRIPAGDKNEAAALCERYRAAGGSCLIAR